MTFFLFRLWSRSNLCQIEELIRVDAHFLFSLLSPRSNYVFILLFSFKHAGSIWSLVELMVEVLWGRGWPDTQPLHWPPFPSVIPPERLSGRGRSALVSHRRSWSCLQLAHLHSTHYGVIPNPNLIDHLLFLPSFAKSPPGPCFRLFKNSLPVWGNNQKSPQSGPQPVWQ